MAAEEIRVYEQELPAEDDPDVLAQWRLWVREARDTQRPGLAALSGVGGAMIGAVLWGELNRWTAFQMPWLVMAGTAGLLGWMLGLPVGRAGKLFETRWVCLAAAFGFAMGVLGDLYARTALTAASEGTSFLTSLLDLDLSGFMASRQPIDWLVCGLGALAAFVGAKPSLDERQLLMEARIQVHVEDLVDAEAPTA